MKNVLNISLKSALLGAVLTFAAGTVFAEVAVVVHPSNDSAMSTDDISKLYLGKTKKFTNGQSAIALDRTEGSDLRVKFLDSAVGKDESQMKSYWSRLIFTGKGVPPKVVETDAEVKELVSRNPDTIGYIDSSSVDDTVKVIATF